MKLQSVRGMNDIAPPESATWNYIEDTARILSKSAGFGEIRTPAVEPTALFKRGVGEATDIVEKEMYTFDDRSGDSLTLRPEGTAPVVRAAIQHGWTIQQSIMKLFYIGPMFRHERPQKGRYRQFYQYGLELFGVHDPRSDAEVISLGWDFLQQLGIEGVELRVSSLGTDEDRGPYLKKLSSILRENIDRVPEDFHSRIDSNPLRIFDHKSEKAQSLASELPLFVESMNEENRKHFDQVCGYLDQMNVPFVIDPKIVRGLDYYSHTAFEYVAGGLGQSQNSVGGGGRYNKLFETLGGRPTPAVGLAMGLDRLFLLLEEQKKLKEDKTDIFIAAQGEAPSKKAMGLSRALRQEGFVVEIDLEGRSLKAQFKRAAKLDARVTLVIGEDEIQAGQIQVKNMREKDQVAVSEANLLDQLTKILQS